MKFLCLHGNGTNSNVMKLQTDGHEYEFVEAAIEAPMSEGVETLASPDAKFYAFYDPNDLSTVPHAISQLDKYVAAEGPFDGLVGFSAGAVLAAMYLAQKQRQGGEGGPAKPQTPPFRCAVFLSSASSSAEFAHLGVDISAYSNDGDSSTSDPLIKIPTAHIWGSADETAPTGGLDLSRLCDPATRLTLVHDGGHEVPRKNLLTESVHIIRRTILLAEQ
ncbi:hypothetical protein ACRALDRAFT_1080133 [Sodiomyces alcalophilus JCM 7366]|uniref:uncharacterized protein n=1 Tax=Sodiomyces alcalophilus JCM 7366 TaxID=591952 RepID=UPI0039B4F6EE